MPKPLRFHQRLNRYPPILVRLLAQHRRGRQRFVPTDQEIAELGGLPIAEVKRLSYSTSWEQIPVDLAYRFLAGCQIDLERRSTLNRLEYMRAGGGRLTHLQRSPLFDSQFREMLDLWAQADTAGASPQ